MVKKLTLSLSVLVFTAFGVSYFVSASERAVLSGPDLMSVTETPTPTMTPTPLPSPTESPTPTPDPDDPEPEPSPTP